MGKHLRLLLALVAALLLFAGYMPVRRGEVPAETFQLGEDIFIAGVNVSRLSVANARLRVQEKLQSDVNNTYYHLRLSDESDHSLTLHAAKLPLVADVESALREAAWLPQHNGLRQSPRTIPVAFSLDTAAMEAHANQVCSHFYIAPVDASAQFDPNVTGLFRYEEARTGRCVEKETVIGLFADAAKAVGQETTLTVPSRAVAPAYTVEMARAERQCIATFTTSFKRSPHNAAGRVFNIKKAASLINGITVQPGEEFDINAILGPRNAETGWRKAAGIRDGKYQQEYGGGVCQVSTTLFNAVMMADLTVTERRPHSWPSGYVDIGRDATISTGGPNFKFVNSSDVSITVVASTGEDKTLTVSIYGKPLANGVTIKVSSERTGTLRALGKKVLLDASLPAGTSVTEKPEHRGKTSKTYKTYYAADGTVIKKVTAYEDTYRSIQGVVYVSADLYYGENVS